MKAELALDMKLNHPEEPVPGALFPGGVQPWALKPSDIPDGIDLPAPVSSLKAEYEEKLKEGCGWIVDQGNLLWNIEAGYLDYWMEGETLHIVPHLEVSGTDYADVEYPTTN